MRLQGGPTCEFLVGGWAIEATPSEYAIPDGKVCSSRLAMGLSLTRVRSVATGRHGTLAAAYGVTVLTCMQCVQAMAYRYFWRSLRGYMTTSTALDAKGFDELEQFIKDLDLEDSCQAREGALIEVLHKAQSVFAYLPSDVQEFVAEKLQLSLGHVYGVISFYSYFTTERKGQLEINFCTGTACFVQGAGKVIERFEELLGIKMGEVSADGKFSLGHLRCVGACSLAPVVMVNDKTYGNVTPEIVPQIIADCQ